MIKCLKFVMMFAFMVASVPLKVNASDESSPENLLFMEIPVCVAAMTSQSPSDAPAVVTIITREEIQNSGARELNDILSMVPGFTPAMEVQGVVGYGVRGLWSLEGKMLIMIDGIPINEPLFGNSLFGGNAFVDYIQRIEIIRGPGSALYGGFGELAVINIITKNEYARGTTVSTMYGQMSGTYGHRSFNVNHTSSVNGVKIYINAAVGDSHQSDRDFIDVNDQPFPMKDFSANNNWFAKIGVDYKDFSMNVIGNSYIAQSVALWTFNSALNVYNPSGNSPLETKFTSYAVDSKYKLRLGDNFSITPRITYTETDGWMVDTDDPVLSYYNFHHPSQEAKINLAGEYDLDQKTNLIIGGEYTDYKADSKGFTPLFSQGASVDYNIQSVFGEFMAKTEIANVTVGARYDKQSHFGGAFVPRFVITKTVGAFNLKGLLSRAYRAPTIMNIDYNPNIKPEYTNAIEAEATYMIKMNRSISLNVFDMQIQDVIVYDANLVTYNNFGKTGTRGFDLSYKMSECWGYLDFSYSYYKAIDNEVPTYVSRDANGNINNDVLLGFPASKAALSGSYQLSNKLSVNPSILYLGQRYTTYWSNAAGGDVSRALDPVTQININLRAKEIAKNLEISLAVYNIFDNAYDIAPGYYKAEQPTPSYSREYTVKLTYNF
jgi:outer membrane receptor for ferrienterochelin and colicin